MDQSESKKCSQVKLTPLSSYLCEIGMNSCDGNYGEDCRWIYCVATPITVIFDTLSYPFRLCKLF